MIGSDLIGPKIKIAIGRQRAVVCPGCAVSVAESLYAQVRRSQRASSLVQQRIDPDLQDLARGMK